MISIKVHPYFRDEALGMRHQFRLFSAPPSIPSLLVRKENKAKPLRLGCGSPLWL
jgi:hypothetical protein